MRSVKPSIKVARRLGAWAVAGVVACGGAPAAPVVGGATAPIGPEVLARWEGGSVRRGDLEGALSDELRALEIRHALQRYDLVQRSLDARVEDALVEQARVDGGYATREALVEAEVAAKAPQPSEEELRAAFSSFVRQMPSASFEMVRPYLAGQIARERSDERYAQWIEELKDAAHLTVSLPYPEVPRVDVALRETDPSHGPREATVTVVMFGEYQCLFCRRAMPALERLTREHPDVRVVFKDFPISGHESARSAAVAARCAGQQGRYWEMGHLLMRNQDRLSDTDLRTYAGEVGLDLSSWDACVADGIWLERVDENVRDGRVAGVDVTPTFFVNGRMVAGSVAWARLEGLVQDELQASRGDR
jgi:protein-disulfide isomerase